MQDIDKLILSTLAYYNLFDFPLTREEVEKYLVKSEEQINHSDIVEALDKLVASKKLVEDRGFCVLSKQEHIIPVRIRKTRIAQRKMHIAKQAAKWMSLVPYIRGVFASGSLALGNTNEESDLDFFVITKHGRIWTARFLATALLSLLRLRRKAGQQIAPDKVCLNHYISDDNLTISNHNIFTARIYTHLIPLYLDRIFLRDEFKNKNQWILDLVQAWPTDNSQLMKKNLFFRFIKIIQETLLDSMLGSWLERIARKYQKARIEKNPATRDPHGRIEYSDQALQFHPDSIEVSVLEKYQHTLFTL